MGATKSKSKKPSKPRPLADEINHQALGLGQNIHIRRTELISYDVKGARLRHKVYKRDYSVFEYLAQNGRGGGEASLSPKQAEAGHRLFELYAQWKGMAGRQSSEEIGRVQQGRFDPELVNDRMIKAGNRFLDIINRLDQVEASLMRALCDDMLLGDGSIYVKGKPRPVMRWRQVVQHITGVKNRENQNNRIVRLCASVLKILSERC